MRPAGLSPTMLRSLGRLTPCRVVRTDMSLSRFIRDHHHEIIDGFEAFARTLGPITADMSGVELRDHAEELLTEIVADMETEQSRDEQTHKSEGRGITHAMQASGRLHADARIWAPIHGRASPRGISGTPSQRPAAL